MRRRVIVTSTMVALVASLLVPAPAGATTTAEPEVGTASVSGTVTDAGTGKPVPAAVVTLTDQSGEQAAQIPTGSTGGYTASAVKASTYTVSVSATGYRPGAGEEPVTVAAEDVRVGIDIALVPTSSAPVSPVAPETAPPASAPSAPPSAAPTAPPTAAPTAPPTTAAPTPPPAPPGITVPTAPTKMSSRAAAATGTITGTVTDSLSGKGIGGAHVSVSSDTDWFYVLTSSDGKYSLGGLTAGVEYRLYFSGDSGHAGEYWNDTFDWNKAKKIKVTAGQTLANLNAALVPFGKISGKVTSEATGKPVAGASVNAYGSSGASGATTDANGNYTIGYLPPGTYTVQFQAPALYAGEFWKNATSAGTATTVTVKPAATTSGITAALGAESTISGRVTNATNGKPAYDGRVVAQTPDGSWVGEGWINIDGSYRIPGLSQGTYILRTYAYGSSQANSVLGSMFWKGKGDASTATKVTVGASKNLTGYDFALKPAVDVTGALTVQDPAAVTGSNTPWVTATAYRWNGATWAEVQRVTGWSEYSFTSWYTSGWGNAALSEGDYKIGFSLPGHCTVYNGGAGSLAAAPTISLTAGTTKTGVTAALKKTCGTVAAPAAPTVSGTFAVGSTLTAKAGTWTPAPVSLAYQWLRDGTAISGATATTYKATSADLNKKLSVRVTGSKSGYTSSVSTSRATTVLRALTATPVPTLSGTLTVGSTLTAKAGTWSPAPVTLAYQWLRGGTAITGATAGTYKLTAADAGKSVTVRVTGSKSGYATVSTTSKTNVILLTLTTTPVPTISGTATAGSTLTAKPGTWAPAPVTLAYQWYRNGAAIAGATTSKYTLTATDPGTGITVKVTGSKQGYASVAKTSKATTVLRTLTATPVPLITGTLKAGSTIAAQPGTWSPATVTLAYQWFRDGVAISGATASKYTLTTTDRGKSITVRVTGSKSGYLAVSKTSAAKKIL